MKTGDKTLSVLLVSVFLLVFLSCTACRKAITTQAESFRESHPSGTLPATRTIHLDGNVEIYLDDSNDQALFEYRGPILKTK